MTPETGGDFFVPQRDKDGFLLPGGPYHGAATHGHCTDDNA